MPAPAHSAHAGMRALLRRVALHGTAVALILAGGGFLTAALWMHLARLHDALFASAVLGAGLVGLGLLVMGGAGLARRRASEARQAAAQTPPTGGAQLIDAFFFGFNEALRRRGREGAATKRREE